MGTHGRIEFGDAHAGRLQRGEAAEQGIGNEPGDTLQEVAGGVHDVADHLIGFGIVDGVGDIVGESSGHDVAMHDDGHLVVVAYDALLRQHAVVGMKAQSVEGDFTVQSSKLNALRAVQSSKFKVQSLMRCARFTFHLRRSRVLFLTAFGGVLLQGTLYTDLPGVDALVLKVERCHQFHDVLDGHAVAKYAGDELGVVPILLIEFL